MTSIQSIEAANFSLRAYVARETLISVLVNVAISGFMTWLVFGGDAAAARSDVLVDFLPQTFMIALMGSLVPGAIARKQVRRGAIPRREVAPPWPRSLLLRSLFAAVASTLVFGAIGAAIVVSLFDGTVPFAALMVLKCVYGAVVAAAVTPIAVMMALGDR